MAPGTVSVMKSDDALHIECEDGEGIAKRSVIPAQGGMIWGMSFLEES